jgi:hypothetical protein
MHSEEGQTAVWRILGVLSLAKQYRAATVDDACSAGLEAGACNYYRLVRRCLRGTPNSR